MGNILDQKKLFSELTLIAIEAALLAGDILKKGFKTQFPIFFKEGKHNLVTDYDYLAEKTIIDFIKKHAPDSQFLAEESGKINEKNKSLWIIDPLDGTVNFAHQIPFFCVSIALEQGGQIISGVIFDPIHQDLFVAEKGKGAFLNNQKIQVSSVNQLDNAVLGSGLPYNLYENPFHCIEHLVDILKIGLPIRRIGSAALELAYTASGRIEGSFDVGLFPWDCAAGKLLVEEAGGIVTYWDQLPFDIYSNLPIVASNGHIHQALSMILNRTITS